MTEPHLDDRFRGAEASSGASHSRHGSNGSGSGLPRSADEVVDELFGDELDWQRLVRRYPTPAVALALAGGCWLGYRHGRAILAAVTGYMASEAARRVNDFLGEEAL